ncbi:MAG: hypothetical protein EB150_02160 [Nitrososphaeria archaeon]|nr:hypothetical protein [Nitrososphaeria archaeon]NDB87822.1 hypothetical protein [Nitrososphaerota archaeon]NDF48192.1 hypothetical protein [Nitrosopumilaceae archaeon]NDB47299.1 hypothetical protein [Nitrososphaeria archaeon]NDB89741.1 hypothetical protein [Nitrososphaerota archaeon]
MKKVRGKLYLHRSAIQELDENLQSQFEEASVLLPNEFEWNILRFDLKSYQISFLKYADFESDPHPSLIDSITTHVATRRIKHWFASSINPPILHRKETFIMNNDPNFYRFHRLTLQEEEAGLLDPRISHKIGFKKQWEELLESKNLQIINHQLVPPVN